WWLALRESLGGQNIWLLPWLATSAGYALLYLYDPCDDPFHFWRVRRYVPVIIPGFMFFAAVALARGLELVPEAQRATVLCTVCLGLVGFAAWTGRAFWWQPEDAGCWDQVKALADLINTDDLVFACGRPEWMTPLYVAFDRCVVPIDLDQDQGWEL